LDLHYDNIPQPVLHETKRRLIDALGCAIGAFDSEPCRIVRQVARTVTTPAAGATVLGTRHRTTADMAAFANGAAVRYLDFNDTYLSKEPAHPSDNISAALAVGEAEGRSGKDILAAIVLAYEVQCRLCDAASIRARGWDHVTYGAYSVSLLAGKLYGLTHEQLVQAVGLAGVPNNALRQTRVGELSHWKGCAFANVARNGVFAAQLAQHGLTGPSEVFEGEMGFWKQVSAPFELAPMAGSGRQFMILSTSMKNYPADYHSLSAIEAALSLRAQIPSVDDIESITIESFEAAVDIIAGFAEHWRPENRETADHSMPYCVAAALMDGDITLASFTEARIRDPQLLALIQKVTVNRNSEMTAGYPAGVPNLLKIRLKNGQLLTEQVTYPLGHARNPMSDADLERKYRSLAERVFPPDQVGRQLDALWRFETLEGTQALRDVFDLFVVEP
jgi:2-methylcitrate dehydratase